MLRLVKQLLPDRSMMLTVWAGPFRGARVMANPRASLRKVLGLYEHELNGWLERALPRVSRLIDVGANDGYFTFGFAAAMGRFNRPAEIICFEPQPQHQAELRGGIAALAGSRVAASLIPSLAGGREAANMTTLDALPVADRDRTLIKIDVEGAELDVMAGARSWLRPSNLFVIEVHKRTDVEPLLRLFADHGLALVQVDQRPLPILGREERDADNRWLVSTLPA